jgi:invasion protein IalB
MSLRESCLRVVAPGLGLALALSLAIAPAHPQAALPGGSGGLTSKAPAPSGTGPASTKAPAGAWVRLCDRGRLSGKDKSGREIAKDVEMCMTLTEQIHPNTGIIMLSVVLQRVRMDGTEKDVLTVTVPQGVIMDRGAAITVFPTDLWLKVQRNEKLDGYDESRLKARSVKLAFKQCVQAGCIAEAEATPLLIDLLTGNAGLLVHTVRSPSTPVSQPVSLDGFAQALQGPPTDTKAFRAARTKLLEEIHARQKAKGR